MGKEKKGMGTLEMKNMKKIYILHGWAYTTEKWHPFLDFLKQQGIETVLLKIPGLTAPLNEVWTLDDYVDWLNKKLIHEKEKVILLGHSNGGRISLAFALKYPEKISQLILVDSAGIYHNELPLRMKRFIFGAAAKAGRALHNNDKLRKIFYTFVREQDYERANPIVRKTMRNLLKVDLRDKLYEIMIKTLIIWGEHDRITPLSDGELMSNLLPQASLHIISGARHSPQFTHAKQVSEIISKDIQTI
jgi:pimeloyl-ACP methyl ester carboxylesterase